MEPKEIIKQKLNIVDIIREYVQLTKAGSNYKGRCPFHSENSPSFMVSEDKQIFHCFGCSEGGDIFSFVEKIERCDFVEALKLLAPKAGISEDELFKGGKKEFRQKDVIYEINKRAAVFFNKLLHTSHGKDAYDYLIKRGLDDLIIDAWQLGYAPEGWNVLGDAIIKKGFKDQDLLDAGLCSKNEKGRIYDRFRDRVVFPIDDAMGRVVGFTARVLHPLKDNGAKYINSPETLIYKKSDVIFGLAKAKKAIREKSFVILVEGNMDVIMSHMSGVTNCVATSGTALTERQVLILKRLTETIYLCFDNDSAGQAAAWRSLDLLLAQDFIIKVIDINHDQVKDPADAVMLDKKIWHSSVEKAEPMMEYLIKSVIKKFPLSEATTKRKAVETLKGFLFRIPNSVERRFWVNILAQRLDVPEDEFKDTNNNPKNAFKPKPKPLSVPLDNIKVSQLYGLIVNFTDRLPKITEFNISSVNIDDNIGKLVEKLVLYYNKARQYDEKAYVDMLQEKDLISLHTQLSLVIDKDFYINNEKQLDLEIDQILTSLKNSTQKNNVKLLQAQLLEAEKQKDSQAIKTLMEKIASLTNTLS